MFTAAVIAAAAGGERDVHACLRTGLTVVPPRSRLARAVRDAVRLAREHADFDTVVDLLHAAHGAAHHWVHAVPNTALLAAALTHADGDFTASICRAVSGGWDTDSVGATARQRRRAARRLAPRPPRALDGPAEEPPGHLRRRLRRHRLRHPGPSHPSGGVPPMTPPTRPPPRPRLPADRPARPGPRHPLRPPPRGHPARRLRRRCRQNRTPPGSPTPRAATDPPRTASACGGRCSAATSAPSPWTCPRRAAGPPCCAWCAPPTWSWRTSAPGLWRSGTWAGPSCPR